MPDDRLATTRSCELDAEAHECLGDLGLGLTSYVGAAAAALRKGSRAGERSGRVVERGSRCLEADGVRAT